MVSAHSCPRTAPRARRAAMNSTRRRPCLSPILCVCVLSHKRLDLLRTTLRAIVTHLDHVERGLAYELVWVDNGSDEAERHAVHREFAFEKALLLGGNYGMAFGFNSLFFRLCSAPYLLTLEEDWEWVGGRHGVGRSALRDAMAVLRHDPSVSGVFLRPDTLDQFLRRSEWRHAPRSSDTAAAAVDARGQPTAAPLGGVEYATYCMDRSAAYLWGPYSNGPGVYDRARLQHLVGRQFGEPADRFPDAASESNYCYRVGAAGLCSAVLRVWPGCEGVHECNAPLFVHLGDERSHGYGKGRRPEIRWLLYGSVRRARVHVHVHVHVHVECGMCVCMCMAALRLGALPPSGAESLVRSFDRAAARAGRAGKPPLDHDACGADGRHTTLTRAGERRRARRGAPRRAGRVAGARRGVGARRAVRRGDARAA